MTPEEFCRSAQALIDTPEKWCKEQYVNNVGDTNQFCSVGALATAAYKAQLKGRMYAKVREALDAQAFELGYKGGLVQFNDAGNTTHDDVMALFDKAAAALAEKVD